MSNDRLPDVDSHKFDNYCKPPITSSYVRHVEISKEQFEKLIREYLSKCTQCDECMANMYCTLEHRRNSREPQDYCISNIKHYLEYWENL